MGVQYENGNIHTPVVVISDDPANPDNVLVSRLAGAVSVPKATVTTTEGTPEVPEEKPVATSTDEEKDSYIKQLEDKLRNALGDDKGNEEGT